MQRIYAGIRIQGYSEFMRGLIQRDRKHFQSHGYSDTIIQGERAEGRSSHTRGTNARGSRGGLQVRGGEYNDNASGADNTNEDKAS